LNWDKKWRNPFLLFILTQKTKNARAPEKCLKFIALRYGAAACYEVFNL
jgi:hypothetical protein